MAWQSSIAVVIGLVVGVALGIVAGRFSLGSLGHQHLRRAQPEGAGPGDRGIALCALLLGNLVAAVPGVLAARTPAALVLRTE